MYETTNWPELKLQRRELRVVLWGVQIVLAATFGIIGVLEIQRPVAELAMQMHWPGLVPEQLVRFIGVVEVLGAFGLVAPAASRIEPLLTPLAAGCLMLVMIFAALFHASALDFGMLPIQTLLGGMAWFVAWGRWKAATIARRDP